MNIQELNDLLATAEVTLGQYRQPISRIECVDGVSLSVQAGEFKYCTPRANTGPWSAVEIGFPSIKPSADIMAHCEDPADPTGTVYAYVPVQAVVDFINEHGGMT